MCGRYTIIEIDVKEFKKRYGVTKVPDDLRPNYNVTPQQNVLAILNETPKELSLVHWGLIPSWAKEINTKYSMINARAETITEKPAYRGIIKRKRCLIVADSFYEWKKVEGAKHPHRILMKDEGLFSFAGVWDHWECDGNEVNSCSIITTAPNAMMQNIHDRMPVILDQEHEQEWLSDLKMDRVLELLKPYNEKNMKAYEVSRSVNSPANNDPSVLEAIAN